jgi:TldD protein
VGVASATLSFWREDKTFANTEGAYLEQTIIESGGGIEAIAVDRERGQVQKRSYPNSFARDQRSEGWEAILAMDLVGNAPRIGEEAVALLTADACPSGVTTLILGPTQLALQIHESCGHPIELDRVFGTEASYAGTSFLCYYGYVQLLCNTSYFVKNSTEIRLDLRLASLLKGIQVNGNGIRMDHLYGFLYLL